MADDELVQSADACNGQQQHGEQLLAQTTEKECDSKPKLRQEEITADEQKLQREIEKHESDMNDDFKNEPGPGGEDNSQVALAYSQLKTDKQPLLDSGLQTRQEEAADNLEKSQLQTIDKLEQQQLEQATVTQHLMEDSVSPVVGTLPEGKTVWGVTSLDDELYVVRLIPGNEVEVYSITTNSLLRRLSVPKLQGLVDVASCKYNRCLYISDWVCNCVHRVEPQGKVTQWPVDDQPGRVSVNAHRNILVVCHDVRKLKEFTTFGQPRRVINLQSDIINPWHAIELSNGQFVVSHGKVADPIHRVCKVDTCGLIVQSYGGPKGSATVGQLNVPLHLAVDADEFIFVAEVNNCRVLLLSPSLSYIREVVTCDQLKWRPGRLHLDVERQRLYVADNEVKNGTWTAGRVVVVELVSKSYLAQVHNKPDRESIIACEDCVD